MIDDQTLAFPASLRSHPLVGMGQPMRARQAGAVAWSRWEAWIELNFKPYARRRVPGRDGNPITLDFTGQVGLVADIGAEFGWRASDARRWVRDLADSGLVADEFSVAVQSRMIRVRYDRRDAMPPKTRAAVLAKTSGRCVYCSIELTVRPNQPNSFHADHVLPVTRGGADDIANLVPSCADCNLRKGSRTIAELCGWTRDIVGVIHNACK